jgi:hypothetical protein
VTVYVFTGPTLDAETAATLLDAVYLPPAQHGDVFRVTRRRPAAIGIVDGYFEHVPAVWHKEILHALAEGIPVYGSASMGALRAAELDAFGMRGVGVIHRWFADGVLEDDDEVAVAHGPAEDRYRMSSEAMVNIRATVALARAESVLDASAATRVLDAAKARFYPERSWPRILDDVGVDTLPAGFAAWVRTHRVDQKRLDAQEMLRTMAADLAAGVPPPQVGYRVEHTVWWDHLVRHAGAHPDDEQAAVGLEALLDELRVQGGSYADAVRGALLRDLLLAEAARTLGPPDQSEVQQALDTFRVERGLFEPAELDRWLAANDLDRPGLVALVTEEVVAGRAARQLETAVLDRLADHLRTKGAYAELASRARAKQSLLAAHGRDNPGLRDAGLSALELCAWHAARLAVVPPASEADVEAYATTIGFTSVEDLVRELLREWFFEHLQAPDRSGGARTGTVS